MVSSIEHFWAWVVYLALVSVLLALIWVKTHSIPSRLGRQCLRLGLAVLLLTPATVEQAESFWSPAWVQGLLALAFSQITSFWMICHYLLSIILANLVLYLILLILCRLVNKWLGSRS